MVASYPKLNVDCEEKDQYILEQLDANLVSIDKALKRSFNTLSLLEEFQEALKCYGVTQLNNPLFSLTRIKKHEKEALTRETNPLAETVCQYYVTNLDVLFNNPESLKRNTFYVHNIRFVKSFVQEKELFFFETICFLKSFLCLLKERYRAVPWSKVAPHLLEIYSAYNQAIESQLPEESVLLEIREKMNSSSLDIVKLL